MLRMSTNPSAVIPTFKRGLPKNILELSQIVNNLKGSVSKKTLIQQLPFVEDPEAELESVEKENKEALKQQQSMFGSFNNDAPEEKEDENSNTTSTNKNHKQDIE